MKKRVLLILPNLKGIKDGINRIQPSFGVGYIAAMLENAGFDVYIHDCALEGYSTKTILPGGKNILIGESEMQISEYIHRVKPDIVGISVLFSNLAEHAHVIARLVKEYNSQVPVILGGNHISNIVSDYLFACEHPEQLFAQRVYELDDPNIDYAMIGECDEAFVELSHVLIANGDPHSIPGLVKNNNGALKINPKPTPVIIDKLPQPARHLMNMEEYFKIGLFHSSKSKTNRVLNIMTSRGCLEKCSFCTTPQMWGNKIRWRDPQNVYDEIKSAIEIYGIEEIQFEDDSLTANIKQLTTLCDYLELLGIPWCTPNGIKANYYIEKQEYMFKRMAQAGCYQITIACESGVQRILDTVIGKRLRVSEVQSAIRKAKDAGLFVHTFWIVGFPGETREEMEQTIAVAENSGADSFSVAICTPLPGSRIYRQVLRENLWWNGTAPLSGSTYRNSLIRVDGFDSPADFEAWVNEQNVYLNSLLELHDPIRAALREDSIYNKDHATLKMKQT